MEQRLAKRAFSLPDLIVRVGAGSPVVSQNYYYYFADMQPSDDDADSDEAASLASLSSPWNIPLPASPPGEVDPEASSGAVPGAFPQVTIDPESPAATGVEPGSDPVAEMLSLPAEANPADGLPNLLSFVPITDEDAFDLSPQLPRNPAVTPAERLEEGNKASDHQDLFIFEVPDETAEKHEAAYPRESLADYFNIPTRVVLHPGTPCGDREVPAGDSLVKNPSLLIAPEQRSDSFCVHFHASSSSLLPSGRTFELAPPPDGEGNAPQVSMELTAPSSLQTLPGTIDSTPLPANFLKGSVERLEEPVFVEGDNPLFGSISPPRVTFADGTAPAKSIPGEDHVRLFGHDPNGSQLPQVSSRTSRAALAVHNRLAKIHIGRYCGLTGRPPVKHGIATIRPNSSSIDSPDWKTTSNDNDLGVDAEDVQPQVPQVAVISQKAALPVVLGHGMPAITSGHLASGLESEGSHLPRVAIVPSKATLAAILSHAKATFSKEHDLTENLEGRNSGKPQVAVASPKATLAARLDHVRRAIGGHGDPVVPLDDTPSQLPDEKTGISKEVDPFATFVGHHISKPPAKVYNCESIGPGLITSTRRSRVPRIALGSPKATLASMYAHAKFTIHGKNELAAVSDGELPEIAQSKTRIHHGDDRAVPHAGTGLRERIDLAMRHAKPQIKADVENSPARVAGDEQPQSLLGEAATFPDPVTTAEAPINQLEGDVQAPLGRRRVLVRKVRNVALRRTALKILLGQQLAEPTKGVLELLASGEQQVMLEHPTGCQHVVFCFGVGPGKRSGSPAVL